MINEIREDGVDRCYCGCKYWEDNRCIDCDGTDVEGDGPADDEWINRAYMAQADAREAVMSKEQLIMYNIRMG